MITPRKWLEIAIDDVSHSAEYLRRAAQAANDEPAAMVALLIAGLVMQLRDGVVDFDATRRFTLDVAGWGAAANDTMKDEEK